MFPEKGLVDFDGFEKSAVNGRHVGVTGPEVIKPESKVPTKVYQQWITYRITHLWKQFGYFKSYEGHVYQLCFNTRRVTDKLSQNYIYIQAAENIVSGEKGCLSFYSVKLMRK